MITVTTEIQIEAPIEQCFDAARDIGLHTQTVWPHTREQAIAGTTSGMIGAGEFVTFQATHFLVKQKLTSQITQYNRPYLFVDEMVKGAFKSLKHEHIYEDFHGKTIMKDRLTFEAPFGFVGWMAERIILKQYMKRFLEYRNKQLKLRIEDLIKC